MTHRRFDMNQHDALYKAASDYPGGIEALAQRMGMSAQVLRNKLAAHCKTHHITLEETSRLIEFLQEAKVDGALQVLVAMNWRHGMVAIAMPEVSHLSDDQLANSVLRVWKENGDVASTLQAALADGRITAKELDDLKREVYESMAAMVQMLDRAEARYADQPSSLRVA